MTTVTATDVIDQKVKWLSPGRIVMGSICVLDGTKGTGKSSIAARIAAAIMGGPPLPGGSKMWPAGVLWFAGEERIAKVKEKVAAAGGSLDLLHFPGRNATGGVDVSLTLPAHADALEATVRHYQARLIVLDTLSCFVGSTDLNQEIPARSVMTPLTRLSEAMECLILCIRHPRKTSVEGAINKGMGNPAIAAVARSVLITGRDPESRQRVLGVVATNEGAAAQTIRYDIADYDGAPVVEWGEEINLDVERFEIEAPAEEIEMVRRDAKKLLRDRIGNSWVPSAEVIAEARRNGISQDQLDRARAKLGVPSRRVGKVGADGHWEYGPPEKGWPSD